MRVISQKGIEPTVDLPYEQATLTVNGKFISAIVCGGTNLLIANYSTPEKAQAALESINKSCPCYVVKDGKETLSSMKCEVFRFPEDSEV